MIKISNEVSNSKYFRNIFEIYSKYFRINSTYFRKKIFNKNHIFEFSKISKHIFENSKIYYFGYFRKNNNIFSKKFIYIRKIENIKKIDFEFSKIRKYNISYYSIYNIYLI